MSIGANTIPRATKEVDITSKTVTIKICPEYFLAKSIPKSNALSAVLEPSTATNILFIRCIPQTVFCIEIVYDFCESKKITYFNPVSTIS